MGQRILLVEDEKPILQAMSAYFEALGFQVACASELVELRERLAEGELAAAIVDLRLGWGSDRDGLEVLRLVKERNPAARVVLLTAFGSPEVESEARRMGAASLLHKPQPLRELARLLKSLLSGGEPAPI